MARNDRAERSEKTLIRHLAIWLLCALLITGCQSFIPQDGIGGTGQRVADGLGGTGQKLEDGIGGTGIVGTITEFGSIWINNAHVHFDQKTPIRVNGKVATAEVFKIGQLAAVLSDPIGGDYQAKRIDIVHEVIGPISEIKIDEQQLTVLNQAVFFNEKTFFTTLDNSNNISALKPDYSVQISGLRRKDGSIFASRVDQVIASNEVQLIGKLSNGRIAGVPLSVSPDLVFDASVDRLLVRGRFIDNVLYADAISKDAILQIIDLATDLLLEGFLFSQVFDGDIVVGGVDIVLPDGFDIDASFDSDEPIFIEAELGDDDVFYSDGLMFSPDDNQDFLDYLPDFEDLTDEELDLLFE